MHTYIHMRMRACVHTYVHTRYVLMYTGLVNAEKNATLCHTWQTTPYLLSRSQQLQSTLTLTAPEITPVQ